jgi:hypothetical protein
MGQDHVADIGWVYPHCAAGVDRATQPLAVALDCGGLAEAGVDEDVARLALQ